MTTSNTSENRFFQPTGQLAARGQKLQGSLLGVDQAAASTLVFGFSGLTNLLALVEPYGFFPAPIVAAASVGLFILNAISLDRARKWASKVSGEGQQLIGEAQQTPVFKPSLVLRMLASLGAFGVTTNLTFMRYMSPSIKPLLTLANKSVFAAGFGLGLMADGLDVYHNLSQQAQGVTRGQKVKSWMWMISKALLFCSFLGGAYGESAAFALSSALLLMHSAIAFGSLCCSKRPARTEPTSPERITVIFDDAGVDDAPAAGVDDAPAAGDDDADAQRPLMR